MDKTKVILGLSGGVDSATAALLLKKQGLTVVGLYFDVEEGEGAGKATAMRAAEQLGIKFIYKNVSKEFKEIVIENFKNEYLNGRTPNPCIVCNPNIKFKTLIDAANEEGAYYIATGHYARTFYDEALDCTFIRQGESKKKDQSYMLYGLNKNVVERLILPLGETAEKEEVRGMAREAGLDNSEAKDSQEICFINENYVSWLHKNGVKSTPGAFVDKSGDKLGEHEGIVKYTIGQRKGLGITFGKPVFVTGIDAKTNEIILGENEDLMSTKVNAVDNFFILTGNGKLPEAFENQRVFAKIRYKAPPAPGIIKTVGDKIQVIFDEPQRAATPGQSLVYYLDEKVIGGGLID